VLVIIASLIFSGPESLSLVYKVTVTDKDAGKNSAVDFSILLGNDDGEFVLNTKDNIGTLQAVKELDREKQGLIIKNGRGVYVLTIKAQDKGSPVLFATTTVSHFVHVLNTSCCRDIIFIAIVT
jgi:hypothetical protein